MVYLVNILGYWFLRMCCREEGISQGFYMHPPPLPQVYCIHPPPSIASPSPSPPLFLLFHHHHMGRNMALWLRLPSKEFVCAKCEADREERARGWLVGGQGYQSTGARSPCRPSWARCFQRKLFCALIILRGKLFFYHWSALSVRTIFESWERDLHGNLFFF